MELGCGSRLSERSLGKLFGEESVFETYMPSEKWVIVAEKINVEEIERDTSRRKQEERQEIDSSIGSALEKISGGEGGAVKEVISTIASGVGTLLGGVAKAIGGMISTFASWFGW